jgi:hypothetical protein
MTEERAVPWILAAMLAVLLLISVAVGFGLGRLEPARPAPTVRAHPAPVPVPARVPAPAPAGSEPAVESRGSAVVEGERLPSDALPGEASVWPVGKEGIDGAVRESLPRMKRCYEAELALDDGLEAEIVARFEIEAVDGVGRVTGLDLATAAPHDALDACITDVLADLAFDAPTEAVSITYPLVFARR